jgi:hypothetical protein
VKIIEKPRGAGKTTDLVKLSAETNVPILAWNVCGSTLYKERARELGIKIPEPVRFSHGRTGHLGEVMIDDLDAFLYSIVGSNVSAATITGKYRLTKEDIANALNIKVSDFDIVEKDVIISAGC